VAGFKSEWWPDLFRNGGRLQIGTPAGFSSEHPAGLNRNPQADAAYYRQASSNALLSGDISAAGDVLKAVSPLFGV
jgi:hypothetical protein